MNEIKNNDVFKFIASKEFKDFFEHAKKILIPSFITNDWYLSSIFLDLAELENLYHEENTKNLDSTIVKRSEKYVPKCKQRLVKQFPQRKKIINEIFYCYKNLQYSAVIALVYSSVEGIVYDNFGQSLWGGYDKKAKKNSFEKLRDNNGLTGVMNIFYKRFSERGEINSHTKDLASINIKSNNRHLVLHGHSLNYGSKKNAIKAILLFDFISEVVFWEKVWKKHIN